jgi:2'-5' RNA ligase
VTDGARLFVGIPLAVAPTNALAGAAETLARRARDAGVDVRWVAPASYHVTLRYLGWTRRSAVSAIRDALVAAAAGAPRLTLRAARLGAFESLDRARVVWAGIEDPSGAAGGGPLGALAERVDAACRALGCSAEARSFHAHVTLGRLREPRALREVVLPLSEQMFGDTRADAMMLYESEVGTGGSAYRIVEVIRLGAPAEDPRGGLERQTAPLQLGARDAGAMATALADTDDGWPRGWSAGGAAGASDEPAAAPATRAPRPRT